MKRYHILIMVFCITSVNAFSQYMSISGNVQDTTTNKPLQYSVVIVDRIKDSTLIAFTRTDAKGFFSFPHLSIDTVQVTISSPKFGDQSFYVFGSTVNNAFDFGKIILPAKSQQLNEVVIYAYKDPVYYKGDTLIYAADSFKVKPNATVEDLLKKLPGIKVDGQGKITAQGEAVDQVLVDGDEFFGSDPTAATKNLNANSVESVQVYEKKNDAAKEDGTDETVKVMNLKLKEDAKKGYFGKASGASDFQKFYEGELLGNKFNNKRKISVFALGSNTPHSNFGWQDINKYGLDNESNWSYDEDNDDWTSTNDNDEGIPRALKSGIYYNDKLGKKTKIGFNYTYNNNQVKSEKDTRSQYFLADTSYTVTAKTEALQKREMHNVNFSINQTLDSLTELEIKPSLKYTIANNRNNTTTDFLKNNDTLSRRTNTDNASKGLVYDISTSEKLTRKFKKKDRVLSLNYNMNLTNNESEGILKSSNTYYNSINPNDSIDQKKLSDSKNQTHNTTLSYTEPLNKKVKLEFIYNYVYSLGTQYKKAFNYNNNEYALKDSLFTNNFENKRFTNRFTVKFIYEVKKQKLSFGTGLRQVSAFNTNLLTQQKITQTVNNALPFLTYSYRFSDNTRFTLRYSTNSALPSLNQLQPVPDNTNPNQVRLGNVDLLPTFENKFELSFNSYKPITGKYIWANINWHLINNRITDSIAYDAIGRTYSKAKNVNGDYYGYAYVGGELPIFSGLLKLSPDINCNYSSYSSYINSQKNITKNAGTTAGLYISMDIDTLNFRIGGSYTYNSPTSTVNSLSNKPYTSQGYKASFGLKLPLKMRLESDADYTINDKRSAGYNINYLIWNASLTKTFFKNENLIVSFEAHDILNQNINTERSVYDNVITDTKTNIISRYYLLKAVYKFNSNNKKEDEDFY